MVGGLACRSEPGAEARTSTRRAWRPAHQARGSTARPRVHVLACDLMGKPYEPPIQSPTTRPRTHDGVGVGDDTLDVAAAAKMLGRSENTVRRLIRAGDLPADQVHGTRAVEYRLREADVRDALGRLGAKASSRPWARGRLDAYDNGRVNASSVADAPAPTSAAAAGVAGVQALIEQATAPLIEANRRLQDANERLTDQLMSQAEELGRLRERLDAAESVGATQPDQEPPAMPASDAPHSHDPDALWDMLATHTRPTPTITQPTPVPPYRRSFLRRLLNR
jgi:excisionase family DNA binding protein